MALEGVAEEKRTPALQQPDQAVVEPGAIGVGGVARLRLLKSLARHADSVSIYAGVGDSTAWELRMPYARFLLLLSADVWRGFSGEGQALSALA